MASLLEHVVDAARDVQIAVLAEKKRRNGIKNSLLIFSSYLVSGDSVAGEEISRIVREIRLLVSYRSNKKKTEEKKTRNLFFFYLTWSPRTVRLIPGQWLFSASTPLAAVPAGTYSNTRSTQRKKKDANIPKPLFRWNRTELARFRKKEEQRFRASSA